VCQPSGERTVSGGTSGPKTWTPRAFERDPALVWEWYNWRREKVSGLKPNPAHYALVELGKRFRDFTIITQNVDGLHALAGSSDILELHGNIWRVRCVGCARVSENRKVPIEIPPRCECGGLLRPDIVWFGEALPEEVVERAFKALERTDFILVVGTSGIVQPAASFAATAKGNGAFLVEINLERTPLSDIMDIVVPGKAGEVLPKLL
jgi:NAD-dependent deacetylase